jgi:hypothetical protein
MTEDETTDGQLQAGWRLYVGTACFAISLGCPIFIPLVAATGLPDKVKTVLSGALVVGIPQVFTLAAIVCLGRAGFNYLRGKLFAAIRKLGPPKAVSRTRYRIGVALFAVPLIVGWVGPYLAELSVAYHARQTAVAVAGDLVLVVSLFVLGGEFWEKVRSLFIYDAKVEIRRPQAG